MKRFAFFSAVLALSASFLVACGGSDSPAQQQVATSNFSANAAAANTVPLTGATLTSDASGVSAFGTTTTTTMVISGAAGSQTAVISSGGFSATTKLTYGSCIFTVVTSNFPAGSSLALGRTVTVNPCTVTANTAGVVVDAPAGLRTVTVGGTGVSFRTRANMSVGANSVVTINGTPYGTVTLGNATGA
jgi:hypothetical protein